MTRRVALTGVVLMIAGIGLQLLTPPASLMYSDSGPLTGVVNAMLQVFPTLCVVSTIAGAIMLVLALLAQVTGDPPPGRPAPTLMWGALALILATSFGYYLLQNQEYATMEDVPVAFIQGAVLTLNAGHVVAGACIALWLAGQIVGQRARASQEHDPVPLVPSRPF